jgi:hypothetical protein
MSSKFHQRLFVTNKRCPQNFITFGATLIPQLNRQSANQYQKGPNRDVFNISRDCLAKPLSLFPVATGSTACAAPPCDAHVGRPPPALYCRETSIRGPALTCSPQYFPPPLLHLLSPFFLTQAPWPPKPPCSSPSSGAAPRRSKPIESSASSSSPPPSKESCWGAAASPH